VGRRADLGHRGQTRAKDRQCVLAGIGGVSRGHAAGSLGTLRDQVSPAEHVAKILGWLDLPAAERPTFLALYFEQVDHAGHQQGPDSPQVGVAISRVDPAIGALLDGLRQRGIER
jgi:predicted AlkP superfamily pyrophosphatase or phosphodiesterase